jgi:hypothetical protein
MNTRKIQFLMLAVLTIVPIAAAQQFGEWITQDPVIGGVNSVVEDFQPFVTKDGMSMYFVRIDRPGTNQDIWVSHRGSLDGPWLEPERLPAPINGPSTAEATPYVTVDGHYLYFASNRAGGQGRQDLYVSWRPNKRVDSGPTGWQTPINLGAVNSSGRDVSPVLFENDETGTVTMYFNSDRAGTHDIYSSTMQSDGTFGPAVRVDALSSAFIDEAPTISHDGKEIYFASDRPGAMIGPDLQPSPDIWRSTRAGTAETDSWSIPEPVTALNTPFHEGRPSLSFDGSTMYFFAAFRERNQSIFFDIWVATREKLRGPTE